MKKIKIFGAFFAFLFTAHLSKAVDFNTNDNGVYKPVHVWAAGARDIQKSIDSMNQYGRAIHAVRIGGVQEYKLKNNGELSNEAKAEIDADMEKWQRVPGNNVRIIPMASGARDKVHSWYLKNGNEIRGNRWRDMFKAVVDYVFSRYGAQIMAIEPLNEPDYGGKYGNKDNWNDVLRKFQEDPILGQYPIVGPSTLSSNAFAGWYKKTKNHTDWGATHWINGSTNNYINFLKDVGRDGKIIWNSEMHNLIELIIGAEHNIYGSLIWGGIEPVEAAFAYASQEGRRIAYKVNRNKQTAAAAYKVNNNTVYLFAAGSERHADDHTYTFRSTNRDVYFNGVGPQREFKVDVGKNSRVMVEVTW